MRITIMAIGSRGDVQPLVALGAGLTGRGHRVRLVAGDEFAPLVAGGGPEFVALGTRMQSAMAGERSLFSLAQSIEARVLAACTGEEDAIVATFLGVATCGLTRQRGIPFFYAVPMPTLSTGEFASPLFPPLPLGPAYNRLTYRLGDRVATRSYSPAASLLAEPRPTYLFCYSEHVVPRPADWAGYAHVTGYWFLDAEPAWAPPPRLVAFLEAGPSPVYVGFGSMVTGDAQRLTATVLRAVTDSGQRGLLGVGAGAIVPGDLPPTVMAVESVPHSWLFPRLAAAVHHGGAGTTGAALRAGIPSVVVPFGIDQPFWGRRLAALGAAPPPLPLRRLTAAKLASAITRACADATMRERAASLGEAIRAEDGVATAVAIIEQVAGRRGAPAAP